MQWQQMAATMNNDQLHLVPALVLMLSDLSFVTSVAERVKQTSTMAASVSGEGHPQQQHQCAECPKYAAPSCSAVLVLKTTQSATCTTQSCTKLTSQLQSLLKAMTKAMAAQKEPEASRQTFGAKFKFSHHVINDSCACRVSSMMRITPSK